MTVDELLTKAAADAIRRLFLDQDRTEALETVEAEMITCQNGCIPVEVTLRLVHFHLAAYVVAVARDITERKRVAAQLEKSLSILLSAIESTADGIVIVSRDGEVVIHNQRFAEMWNLPEGWQYLPLREQRFAFLRRQMQDPHAFVRQVHELDDKPDAEAYDVIQLNDERTFECYSLPYRTAGVIAGRVWSFRDMTERKCAERLLLQTERLKAVGDMAGGVAHNFNNLLQLVIGRVEMALTHMELGNLSKVEANLQQVLEGARMGAQTVRRLQDFARVRTEDPTRGGTTVDLAHTLRDGIEMSKPFWKSSAEKRGVRISVTEHSEPGCTVSGNENELFEVVVNLIKNAAEALPQGGKIDCSTVVSDAEVILTVGDNGIGIREADLGKVFEPFWTTKGPEGTGLGLASSYGIVHRHGGSLSVKSRSGQGTTFTVRLPLSTVPAEQTGIEKRDLAQSPLRMLLIDDLKPVLAMLAEGLRQHGQTVYTESTGRKGLEVFARTEIDVVISDLGMPEMNGWQVAEQLKEICSKKGIPRKPFILLTGWGGQVEEEELIEKAGVDRVLEKPVDIVKLLQVAHELMQEWRGTFVPDKETSTE